MVSPRFFSALFAVVLFQSALRRSKADTFYSADRMDDDEALEEMVDGVGLPETQEGQTMRQRRAVDRCQDNPCENNGTCRNTKNGFRCKCPRNSFGRRCEIKQENGELCCGGKCTSLSQLNLNVTITGYTCQRWDENEPQKHGYRGEKYRDYDLQENYCRNPSGHSGFWCYTTAYGKRWEDCELSFCSGKERPEDYYLILSSLTRVARIFYPNVWGIRDDGLAYIFNKSKWEFTWVNDLIPMVRSLINEGHSVEKAAEIVIRRYAGPRDFINEP